MTYLGILVATVAAFVISSVYYSVAPPAPAAVAGAGADTGRPQPWQLAGEVARSAVVASLVAGLLVTARWNSVAGGVLLGLALTVLPIVLLAGSVLWERVPVRTATTHAVDWAIKLTAVGAIVGAFA